MAHKIGLKMMGIKTRGNSKSANSLPDPPACPDFNPVGMFKSVITEALAKATEMNVSNIYHALEMTHSLGYGDLQLPTPTLMAIKSPLQKVEQCATAVRRLCSLIS
jgi:hypothetical protein